MKKLTPNMAVKDVRETVNYYVNNLGFKLVMAVNDDKSAIGDVLVEGKCGEWQCGLYVSKRGLICGGYWRYI